MGRSKKDIDWKIVERKIEAGCSAKEIAGGLCSIDTFYDRFKEHYGVSFGDYKDYGYESGNGNLKYVQYMKAVSGNVNMLMFLGKERLGQGKDNEKISPYEDLLALRHENMMLRAELTDIKEKNADQSEAR